MQASLPSCPLCGQQRHDSLIVEDAPGLRQCRVCSFIFAPDIHSEDASLYDNNFGDTNVHPTYEKRGGHYVVRNRERLEALLNRLEPYRQTGRILDVGCSAAFFLTVARERGWQPQGAEIAQWAVEFSRQELGLDVFHGPLQAAAFPANQFDVVFSSHVMEHIADPLSLLTEMVRVLRPGGVHVTVVPTQFASPSWKLARRFIGDPPPIHSSFYTQQTYEAFLKKAGLEIVCSEYNVELSRLRDLLRSKEESLQSWRQQKQGDVQNLSRPQVVRPAWIKALKRAINLGGNLLGLGDEILVIAQKPTA